MVDANNDELDPAAITDGTEYAIQYQIKVGSKRYQTTRCLFSYKTDALRGRATRVWEVFLITPVKLRNPSKLVLKDVWLDGPSEGDLWKQLKAEVANNPEDKRIFEAHFLTHVHGEKVHVVPSTLEKSKILDFLFVIVPSIQCEREVNTHTGSTNATTVGQPAVVPPTTAPLYEKLEEFCIRARTHYREVFSQVCEVYHDLMELPTMVKTLCHTVQGMPLFMPSLHPITIRHPPFISATIDVEI